MLTAPNAITILRVLLIPVLVYFLARQAFTYAFLVFLASGLSDLLDGFLARRFNQFSRFGAALDPLADKLTMLCAAVGLAWHGLIPLWLMLAIILRDLIIVSGAVAYHFVVGRVEMAPTLLGKANTLLEFAVIGMVLANAAAVVDTSAWLAPLFILVFLSIAASGAQYVWVWGRKAAHHARRAE